MLHVNDIYRLLDIFIEARDMLAGIAESGNKLEELVDKMNIIIKESHEE